MNNFNGNDALNRHLAANESYQDFLCHHGILGQKWGVRRYQNPDGTLTEAGKARYYSTSGNKKLTKEGAKAVGNDLTRLSKIALKKGRNSEAYKKQSAYIKTKWGENADAMNDWASEWEGATDKADKLWDKAQAKYSKERRKFENDHQIVKEMKGYTDEEKKLYIKDRAAFDHEMYKASITSGIKDKAQKAAYEKRILDVYNKESDLDARNKIDMVAAALFGRIIKESGDYYNGECKTKEFKEAYDKEEIARKQLRDENKRIGGSEYSHIIAKQKDDRYLKAEANLDRAEDELNGVVLRDIGFEDNDDNRKRIHTMIRWD